MSTHTRCPEIRISDRLSLWFKSANRTKRSNHSPDVEDKSKPVSLILLIPLLATLFASQAWSLPVGRCVTARTGQVLTTTFVRATGPNAFLTSDGQEIRLAGIATPHRFALPPMPDVAPDVDDPADDPSGPGDSRPIEDAFDPLESARQTLDTSLLRQTVRLYPTGPTRDRYGRIRANVERVSDGLWVEAELVRTGLARVEPLRDDHDCARELEEIESQARAADAGLWALPEFAVIAADDPHRKRWSGHYVLIEGKVLSHRASGARRYLNFGDNFGRDFAILLVDKGTVARRDKTQRSADRFQDDGFFGPGVDGKRIRVRGILTRGGGGLILPSLPEEIEWVQVQN